MEYKRRTIIAKAQSLSTGPISEEGKTISCQNSTKHGLTSVKLNTAEEQSLYDVMVVSLTEELNPLGMTEVTLVSDMAMVRIHLNRFDRAENALFFVDQDKKATPTNLLYEMSIDGHGLRSEITQKIGSNANYLDEIDSKEKAKNWDDSDWVLV
jgi:hypothetical protein